MRKALGIVLLVVLLPGCSMLSLSAGEAGVSIGISRGQNPLPP